MVEAGKQLYAPSLRAERRRFRRPMVVPLPRPVRLVARAGVASGAGAKRP